MKALDTGSILAADLSQETDKVWNKLFPNGKRPIDTAVVPVNGPVDLMDQAEDLPTTEAVGAGHLDLMVSLERIIFDEMTAGIFPDQDELDLNGGPEASPGDTILRENNDDAAGFKELYGETNDTPGPLDDQGLWDKFFVHYELQDMVDKFHEVPTDDIPTLWSKDKIDEELAGIENGFKLDPNDTKQITDTGTTNSDIVRVEIKPSGPFSIERPDYLINLKSQEPVVIISDSKRDITGGLDPQQSLKRALDPLVASGVVKIVQIGEAALAKESRNLALEEEKVAKEALEFPKNVIQEFVGDEFELFEAPSVDRALVVNEPEVNMETEWGVVPHDHIDPSARPSTVWLIDEANRRRSDGGNVGSRIIRAGLFAPSGVSINAQDAEGRTAPVASIRSGASSRASKKAENLTGDKQWVTTEAAKIFEAKGWANDGNLKYLFMAAEIIKSSNSNYTMLHLLRSESPDELVKKYMEDTPLPDRIPDLAAVLLSKTPGGDFMDVARAIVSDPSMIQSGETNDNDPTNSAINTRALTTLLINDMKGVPAHSKLAGGHSFLNKAVSEGRMKSSDIIQLVRETTVVLANGFTLEVVYTELLADAVAEMTAPEGDDIALAQINPKDPINMVLRIRVVNPEGQQVAYSIGEFSTNGVMTIRDEHQEPVGDEMDIRPNLKNTKKSIAAVNTDQPALQVPVIDADSVVADAASVKEIVAAQAEVDIKLREAREAVEAEILNEQFEAEAERERIKTEFIRKNTPRTEPTNFVQGEHPPLTVPPLPPEEFETANFDPSEYEGYLSSHREPEDTKRTGRLRASAKKLINMITPPRPRFMRRRKK